MHKLSPHDPLFATYVIAATLMILKAVNMSWLTHPFGGQAASIQAAAHSAGIEPGLRLKSQSGKKRFRDRDGAWSSA